MRTTLIGVLVVGFALCTSVAQAQSGTSVAGGFQSSSASSAIPIEARPDGWRYRWHQGHWWYYTPQQTWLWYENNAWKPFIVPPPAPVLPAAQPAISQSPATEPMFGVDSP